MRIRRPLLGQLTQGGIFSCAKAEAYDGCSVHGFVITARCDIEQRKFPILNYLPVVMLDDWLTRDGFDLLFHRISADTEGSIADVMSLAGISRSILLSQSLQAVRDAFFSTGEKKAKSQEEKFAKLVEKDELLQAIFSDRLGRAASLHEMNSKVSCALIKDLVLQKLSGYYFLPDISDSGSGDGFVILLREVRNIPKDVAERVASGLDEDEARNGRAGSYLSYACDPFAMPVGELTSPEVEHVMQAFSVLFGRIGVEDFPLQYVDKISLRRPKI